LRRCVAATSFCGGVQLSAKDRLIHSNLKRGMKTGPRIYNLFPLLAGPVSAWDAHLARIADMQFDWVFVNPFHYPGFSGSLYAVKDYYRLNPLLRGSAGSDDDSLLAGFIKSADEHGLSVMMDLVLNHTARDSLLVDEHPDWFRRNADGSLHSPGAVDPDDPSKVTVWGDLAELDYAERAEREELVDFYRAIVSHYAGLGFSGFRADAAYKVPSAVWAAIISDVRAEHPQATFFAETLGCRPPEITALHDADFDFIFNSAKWWDFKAPWLAEQYEIFRHIAPSIAFPESHDTERLRAELAGQGISEPGEVEAVYRQRYLFAATFSTGVMMPIGFEYGFERKLDVVKTRPEHWEQPLFDLSDFITEVNHARAAIAPLNEEGPQAWSMPRDKGVVAMLRSGEAGDWALTLINPDRRNHSISTDRLKELGATSGGVEVMPGNDGTRLKPHAQLRVNPFEVRVFASKEAAGKEQARAARPVAAPGASLLTAGLHSAPIIIQDVYPELDCGRFPVKREVGDELEVWADVFKEGHDQIRAVLMVRRADEERWHDVDMRLVEPGLDRWQARVRLEENTRYYYTIEAWRDDYETWLDELGKKIKAGEKVGLELIEGREIVAHAAQRAASGEVKGLKRTLAEFDAADSDDERGAILTAPGLRRLMERTPDRGRAVRYGRELQVTVDRTAARFAAWYEMFHRSQGNNADAGASFRDCIARLDEVKAMGFDVVYLVPIHPIGTVHRKGRNNSVQAGDGEPGSPYAIGSADGGHDAVHPELGTLHEFRAFVDDVRARDLEVALDFAIQCAPDHPWVREHPEWFEYRPDGTIKYAENPPKKYQDIVNLNFYGEHRDALWAALRDVVLFWADQGVKIFRVDNPHTKPVPFWEWLIREVQDRHPDVLFLSEAFTRPKMLKMLAKAGFSQSYTYFTWRNFKSELTDYLTELTQSDCRDYLRPNLFTNTPDILPAFLQTGGRPAFQIRLVLAATLSSVYGIYNGFELCEATAVPGTEEYQDSEKYQYKVWDWDRPGNIKDDITAVNRIRRENPALQHLKNLRFYRASDDNVLFYGKMTPERDNIVLIAVNLDPFEAHEADLEFPLAEIGIGAEDPYEVEELLSGQKHLWRGASQHVRLDPHRNPAAIFRFSMWERVDYREPCF